MGNIEIIRNIDGVAAACEPIAVALGLFDGMHLGHVKVIKAAREIAEKNGLLSAVLTFTKNPLSLIAPDREPSRLITEEQKIELISALGIDRVFNVPFSKDFMNILAEEYVRDVLASRLHAAHIVTGPDHRFGARARGDAALLRTLGVELSIGITIVEAVKVDGMEVSSTAIRSLLGEGLAEDAAAMLGRPYSMSGQIVKGKQLGKTLGAPTANILPDPGMTIPKPGVYVTEVIIGDSASTERPAMTNDRTNPAAWDADVPTRLPAVTNVGMNPTVGGKSITVESHIIGFDANIYGKCLTVDFLSMIRGEKKYAGLDELKRGIHADIDTATSWFIARC
ncbi:MAG: riboflavin biosynthesis protein RibF [Clostridiales Family XIII bacterium]|jgi:riboflavin kinase/FMN adenylyltransferase|nr:riboflavin biosynthesis protein RibF [Clostridiales Family XIII bacterium]